ncbi:MAG TPA: aminopeptidase [Gaiellaceae bacterium]|nr:aminopeptidase [Gaiellaceae bacterium]
MRASRGSPTSSSATPPTSRRASSSRSRAPLLATPLLVEIYRRVVRAGGHPLPRIWVARQAELFYSLANDEQLDWINPSFLGVNEHADVRIIVQAEQNTKSLTGADPARQARAARARQASQQRYLQRAAAGDLKWVLTAYPTEAAAQDADMSLPEYEAFVYGAGRLGDPDPVASWQEFAKTAVAAKAFLEGVRALRIVAEGTDLTLGVGDRTWEASIGKQNFPDGEVFTGPVETEVNGVIRFSYPAVHQGREVQDVELRFEGGEVVEASASHGADFLQAMIGMDDGARRLGELAFGLNDGIDHFTRNILFDEKIGGTVHLALGASYPETGGQNRSGLHWDLICDLRPGSEVYADGELVYRDGAFLPGVLATA